MSAIIPIPKQPVSVRLATRDDLAFIDKLQKANSKAVGFMPTQQLEGKIAAGNVLIAEERHEGTEARRHEGTDERLASPSVPACLRASVPSSLGYIISQDRYFKRDDVGIIYQVNVVPEARRGLVAATLVRAVFERAAYGCRLFCCWCAQDLEANRFWEAMGFVPLAFRTGGRGRKWGMNQWGMGNAGSGDAIPHSIIPHSPSNASARTHIFWQRRVRAEDGATPWWYPSQTSSGSLREDRLVLPIPPGRHWSEGMPELLPTAGVPTAGVLSGEGHEGPAPAPAQKRRRAKPPEPHVTPACLLTRGLRFGPAVTEKAKPPRVKAKNDPQAVAAARELRDRWLEEVNQNPDAIARIGKYDVARKHIPMPPRSIPRATPTLLLAAS